MIDDAVTLHLAGGIAVLTIARAAEENMLTGAVATGLEGHLQQLTKAANDVRAVILTAEGNDVFLIGADPREVLRMDHAATLAASERGQELANMLESLPMPVLAAVNGNAIGGGLELMLACDLAIASKTALFVQLETSIGLVPGFGGTYRLPRRIGLARARQMIYTGAAIDAATALSWGLINEVVEPAELPARARSFANAIAANDGPALVAAKASVARGLQSDAKTALQAERLAFAECAGTPSLLARVSALIAARSQAS